MMATFTVRVTKDYLVFCAGHFITFDGRECERLHGHNYRVACELTGPLDANGYVFDFIALKNHLQSLTDQFDHRMLIAERSPLIRCEVNDRQLTLTFQERTWSFPRGDCAILPIENTTAELLAEYLALRLLDMLKQQHNFVPVALTLEVEESFGQAAKYHWSR